MKRFCVALLFFVCWAAHAGQKVYDPASGVYVDMDTGDVYPRVAPNVALDPDSGDTFIPGMESPRRRVPAQRATPAPVAPQPSAAAIQQQQEMAHWCQQVHSIAVTVGNVRATTPTTDPLYGPLTQKWQNYSDTWRAKCQ